MRSCAGIFYFVRLLVVTRLLREVRAGGGGAYIGAVVFPLIAIGAAWATMRLWHRPAAGPPAA